LFDQLPPTLPIPNYQVFQKVFLLRLSAQALYPSLSSSLLSAFLSLLLSFLSVHLQAHHRDFEVQVFLLLPNQVLSLQVFLNFLRCQKAYQNYLI
jgi:hypothetical protein